MLTSKSLIWQTPPANFFILNCNASVSNLGTEVGCGGLPRDERGVMRDFTYKLEPYTVLEAELKSIYHGLILARGEVFEGLLLNRTVLQQFR